MKKCSKYGTENSKDALFCENCGNKLSEDKKIVCPNCGFSNSVESSFCENCGSKLLEVQSNDTVSNNRDNTYGDLPEENSDSTNRNQKDDPEINSKNIRRSQGISESNNLRNIIVAVAIIIVVVIGVFSLRYFKANRQTENSRDSNSAVLQKDKSSGEKSSRAKNHSETSSSSEKEMSDNSEKLSVTSLTNKQNAASILVYGALKANAPLFKGNYDLALKNSQLYVSLVKLDSDETEADETPILYELAPGQIDSSCGYKLGRNREVYFYSQVKNTPGFSRISETTQDEIVDYINSHHLVNKVNELANETTVYGE